MPRGKPKLKTPVMILRVDPRVRPATELAAERDRRRVTSLIEELILNHCDQLGIKPETLTQKENEK